MWLHRRSEEPSPTEVACYWVKSKLSKVGTSIKYLTLKDFGAKEDLSSDEDSSRFIEEVIHIGVKSQAESQLLKYFKSDIIEEKLGLHHLIINFISSDCNNDCSEFFNFCKENMVADLCSEASLKTVEQNNSSLWFQLRYARITASKIYDAAHCKKSDGTLVNQILEKLKKKYSRIGLMLNPRYPIFGASPDAICEEYVVEIKCPLTEKTLANYLTKENKITAKCNAQVQLQMFFFNKKKCLFCVADPNFEKNFKCHYIWVKYDEAYVESIMSAAEDFWRYNIFSYLCSSVKKNV
ncbi:hypothetical protein ABEB36_004048 [Hypothenemus hampei]|uniref:YqaJ viral recombinase domain-containing protein n=1 Tax=Hypothenemus hampei TaxID=57062 RepID=A0ABD1F214_HYPHA